MTKPKPRKPRQTSPKALRAVLAEAIAKVDPASAAPAVLAPTSRPPVLAAPPAAATDTELAFLSLYAEDAFAMACAAGGDLVHVRPDPRLFPRWTILGTLTAIDAPLRVGRHKLCPREVFYGWLLQGAGGQRVLAIRGTLSLAEWVIDATFAPRRAHPVAGRVHDGFYDLYALMRIDGRSVLSAAFGDITVVGHSLGAAEATLAAFELACAGAKVRAVLVASPRVGDATFAKAFGDVVPHVAYVNAADLVPKVPAWFGYCSVPNVVTLSAAKAGITITGGLAAQHHVVSYAAMMDRKALAAFTPLAIDKPFLNCIRFGRG